MSCNTRPGSRGTRSFRRASYRIPAPRDLTGGTTYQDPATGARRTIHRHEFNRSRGNIDYYDEDMRGAMGVAQAYLLKNRLVVTATEFHTSARNDTGFSGFSTRGTAATIWTTPIDSGVLTGAALTSALQQRERINQVQGYLLDAESKGYELEVVGELRPGWSLSVNYSKTKSFRSNIAPEVRANFDHHKQTWLQYRDFALSQNINLPGVERLPHENWNTPAQIAATGDFTANTDTINERLADAEAQFFENPKVFENNRFIGDNLHNLNVRTRYDLRSGRLKGLSVGLGLRLRAGRVAGARAEYDFAPGSSYTDAYNGRVIKSVQIVNAVDQALYDFQLSYRLSLLQRKLGWTVQLNVNNLTDVDDCIVNNTHPRTLAPITYRYQDPRQFILTNTFSF